VMAVLVIHATSKTRSRTVLESRCVMPEPQGAPVVSSRRRSMTKRGGAAAGADAGAMHPLQHYL